MDINIYAYKYVSSHLYSSKYYIYIFLFFKILYIYFFFYNICIYIYIYTHTLLFKFFVPNIELKFENRNARDAHIKSLLKFIQESVFLLILIRSYFFCYFVTYISIYIIIYGCLFFIVIHVGAYCVLIY
jgi:hypothetical protein